MYKDPVKERARCKAYYARNRERLRAKSLATYHANRERYMAVQKASRLARHELHLARKKLYRETHTEVTLGAHQRRRALKKGARGNGWTPEDVAAQYKAQRGCCLYCTKALGKKYHRDHIVPLANGGAHCRSNLALACAHCNLTKGHRDPQEFAGILL